MRLHAVLLLLCALRTAEGEAGPCDASYITSEPPNSHTYDATNHILKCTDSKNLEIKHNDIRYSALTCGPQTGWMKKKDAPPLKPHVLPKDKMHVECVQKECALDPSVKYLVAHLYGEWLTCVFENSKSLKKLKVFDKYYDRLQCTVGDHWKDSTGAVIAKSNVKLTVTCEDYCAVNGNAIVTHTPYRSENHVLTVSCPDEHYGLFKGEPGAQTRVDGDKIECTMEHRWKRANVFTAQPHDAVEDFECKKACVNIKRLKHLSKAVADGIEDGLAHFVDASTTGVFTCTGDPAPGSQNPESHMLDKDVDHNGIKLNDEFVLSNLYCDAKHGWTDFARETKLADAFAPVTIECGKITCSLPALLSCDDLQTPEGYQCIDGSSPFLLTDDPNLLNCGKDPKMKLYGLDTKTFYDKPLVCDDGDKWYKFGDKQKTPVHEANRHKDKDDKEKTSFMYCLRKRCNSCKKGMMEILDEFHVEGTADECATATCPNNLWEVRREGSLDAMEEYAGPLTCQDGKWLMDGETPVDSGYCVPEVDCTNTAKLMTHCEPSWVVDGACSSVTLNDDTEVTCATGKMFYMLAHAAIFEEGTAIQCQKTKGFWTVTKNGGTAELRKGGAVVCADEKPTPSACYLCNSEPLQCATCTDEDINVISEFGSNKCMASVDGVFQTEKRGSVDGPLHCTAAERVWKNADGLPVGKFAKHKGTACSLDSPLKTHCQSGWNGCTAVELRDHGDVKCSASKTMYFMRKDNQDFKEAVAIYCNTAEGVWKVNQLNVLSNDTLETGSSVVCATEKPALTACQLCQPSDPGKGIEYRNSDTETCEAARRTKPFQTQLVGNVRGKLICKKADRIWRTEDSREVGEFTREYVISCLENARLKTMCDHTWKRCDKIDLNDENKIMCPSKTMYFMHPNKEEFQQGSAIRCDKDEGEWKVTQPGILADDALSEGGIVVCADEKPVVTACYFCEPLRSHHRCPGCYNTMYLYNKDDNCMARASGEGQTKRVFETELAGTVTDELICKKNDRVWKTQRGKEVGKFATIDAAKATACYFCESIVSILKCPECSNRINFYNKEDSCMASADDMNDKRHFETESAGTVKDELVCKINDRVWRTKDGKAIGKFATTSSERVAAGQTSAVVAGSMAGVVLLVVIGVVVVKVITAKKRRDKDTEKDGGGTPRDSETRRDSQTTRTVEEGNTTKTTPRTTPTPKQSPKNSPKKNKNKTGKNDEILEEYSALPPSEIKL